MKKTQLIETNSETYLKRIAKELRFRDSIYDRNGRIYTFEGEFVVRDGQLMQKNRVIDVPSLTNGHGESICATRKA